MIDFLRKLFGIKQKTAKRSRVAVLPKPAQPWLLSDVIALRAFINSPTGANLISRGRAMEYTCAVRNARDTFHTQHSAGVTVGIGDTLNWIESLASDETLSKLSLPTDDQPENQNTASGEHDDAALVEKYSP